ncbi:MAG: UDP-N-acetylglucosamine 4,6-dehydratase (EC [uncultured Sulfurovum sp.]|uniref:UDP-N-acetylglucosamine 4,6-dehydratase (EC) n=1 Tax=uncultured Sulfurovum sp. TaxID=269237 RepID=A0A6S6TJE6_9BACT|nr:MAG: UDP-N-acetylglucosamine 4,6-dehydratase (EC [uncultured Sulfurovum sp.]
MFLESIFTPTTAKRIGFFILFDILISMATIVIAYLLRFNFFITNTFFESMMQMMMVLIPLKIALFFMFKIYFVAWRYFGLSEYKRLILVHVIIYAVFTGLFFIFYDWFDPFPRSVIIIDFFLSLSFVGFLRISRRIYLESSKKNLQVPTLIIGTNNRAAHVIKSADNGEINHNPIALLSDERSLNGTYFSNLPVYTKSSIVEVVKKYDISSVILTEVLESEALDELFTLLHGLGVEEIKILEMFQENEPTFKDISVEDLLARQPKDLDRISIANFIAGKVVMITGAGGSIGSELSRQVIAFGAKQLILLDHSEFNLYQISEELNNENIVSVMISVKDREALEEVFVHYSPEVILHAAAYKHVPLCEENIKSAVQNNIFGTKNVIDLSITYEVEKFLLISTDKAVRPTNVMGATKRVCELYARAIPSEKTEIVAVRFGNVLGSSGSVIPKFQTQIENGQNITVTHPDITRYFMLIPEACQLVLQAASIAKGGELFILDMGEPIKIVDLAKKMIELSGRDDIEIEFAGLRRGEKLYEELLIDEADFKTEYESILVSQDEAVDYAILSRQIDELRYGHELEILELIVPEFKHNTGETRLKN